MPRPSPSSSLPVLRAKQALFDDWGLSDDEDSRMPAVKTEDDSQGGRGVDDDKPKSKLSDAEMAHRRKSRAFAVAAKAALEAAKTTTKGGQKERKERNDRERQQRQQDERPQRRRPSSDVIDVIEVIDLTRPKETFVPPPRVPSHAAPRRAHSTLEFVRTSATLRRTSSNPLPASQAREAGQTQPSKKRKVDTSTPPSASTAATARHIFSGLAFYYLPDAALGARKLRIAKAQQHGATWVRRVEDATHVIVDKPLRWTEIASAVHGRRPEAIVVYDEYPLDCIGFRCLLSPAQRRYHIAGRDDAERPATSQDGNGKDGKKTTTPSGRSGGAASRSREREQMIRRRRHGG